MMVLRRLRRHPHLAHRQLQVGAASSGKIVPIAEMMAPDGVTCLWQIARSAQGPSIPQRMSPRAMGHQTLSRRRIRLRLCRIHPPRPRPRRVLRSPRFSATRTQLRPSYVRAGLCVLIVGAMHVFAHEERRLPQRVNPVRMPTFSGFAFRDGSNPCLARDRLAGNLCTECSKFAHAVLYICNTAQRPLCLDLSHVSRWA